MRFERQRARPLEISSRLPIATISHIREPIKYNKSGPEGEPKMKIVVQISEQDLPFAE
jgi:hypothetical protein